MREFLSQYVTTQPGKIIDRQTNKVIGRHDGAIFYTLGQRHGLDVGGGLPYYVVGKDMDKNEVYVSTNLNDREMWREELQLRDMHWIADELKSGSECHVRLRHRGPLVSAHIEHTANGVRITLSEAQRAATRGQSVVMYKDAVCLGGGIVT